MCLYFVWVYACVLAISTIDYGSMYPWAKKEFLKEISYYKTHLRLRELRENGCTMSKKYEGFVKTIECREGEHICCDESSDSNGPFFYFYATFFKRFFFAFPCPSLKRNC